MERVGKHCGERSLILSSRSPGRSLRIDELKKSGRVRREVTQKVG